MILSLIVAMGPDGVIGDDRGLPWHLPNDLTRFRQLTIGKPVIMGRKTAELIGKPLPYRQNIVLTRRTQVDCPGRIIVHSANEALEVAQAHLLSSHETEIMVIGGAQVYDSFFSTCHRAYLTVIDGRFAGRTYFPIQQLCSSSWRLLQHERVFPNHKNPHPHSFYVLERAVGNFGVGVSSECGEPLAATSDRRTLSDLLQEHLARIGSI